MSVLGRIGTLVRYIDNDPLTPAGPCISLRLRVAACTSSEINDAILPRIMQTRDDELSAWRDIAAAQSTASISILFVVHPSSLCRWAHPQRDLIGSSPGNYLHPHWGWHTPLLTLTHTPKLCSPHWGCVYCSSGVFAHSVGFYALVSWAISVLVCLASVCIRILRQCFIIVRFYP